MSALFVFLFGVFAAVFAFESATQRRAAVTGSTLALGLAAALGWALTPPATCALPLGIVMLAGFPFGYLVHTLISFIFPAE